MGLIGGLADVGGLYECLVGSHTGQTSPAILDKYNDIRRRKYKEIVDPISTKNLRRLCDRDPEKEDVLEKNEFLGSCLMAANDKELAVQLQIVRLKVS